MGRSKTKGAKEIDASSMADIAFLLLIFFLVTTTIDQDKGIIHKLPTWSEEPPPDDVRINDRELLEILVNANNQLLLEQDYVELKDLKDIVIKHLDNRGRLLQYSTSPQEAVISLKNDRGTNYGTYIEIQNSLKAGYLEVRNKYALAITGGSMNYKELDDCADNEDLDTSKRNTCLELKKKVQGEYPMKISEAEPVNLGGN
ncbi:MAG: biopolymer transporter ExbD [Crocinitomicaceae bacterium]|nr:biopolymer transporter ExbD [Crocinitomicaceae bacterium]